MTNNPGVTDTIVRYEEVPGIANMMRIVFEYHDALVIPISVWAEKSLRVGSGLSTGELAELESIALAASAKERALRYLRWKPRTAHETLTYLTKNEFPGEIAQSVVRDLEAAGLIDDRAYTEMYLRSKGGASSRREVSWKLKQRGVPRDVIDAEVWSPESEEMEQQAALSLGMKYWQRHQGLENRVRLERLGAYLSRKGFSHSVVRRTLAEVAEVSDSDMMDDLP